MARAGGNSRRTWQPLNSALDPIIEEFGSREFAQRHVLDRLIRKELPCRYLAVDGVRHESDLPELFWQYATVHWDKNWATCPRRVVGLHDRRLVVEPTEAYQIEVGDGDALDQAIRAAYPSGVPPLLPPKHILAELKRVWNLAKNGPLPSRDTVSRRLGRRR